MQQVRVAVWPPPGGVHAPRRLPCRNPDLLSQRLISVPPGVASPLDSEADRSSSAPGNRRTLSLPTMLFIEKMVAVSVSDLQVRIREYLIVIGRGGGREGQKQGSSLCGDVPPVVMKSTPRWF